MKDFEIEEARSTRINVLWVYIHTYLLFLRTIEITAIYEIESKLIRFISAAGVLSTDNK